MGRYNAPSWINGPIVKPDYALSSTARRSRRQLSFPRLDRKLKYIPLGLLWGTVAGGLQAYRYLYTPNGLLNLDYEVSSEWWRVELFFVPIVGAMAGAFLIAVLLGGTLFADGKSSKRWVAAWVFTGALSCAGGAVVSQLVLLLGILDEFFQRMPAWYEVPIAFVALVLIGGANSLETGVQIGMVSAVVALVLAPFSLLARRLILQRRSLAEPTGGTSQTQP